MLKNKSEKLATHMDIFASRWFWGRFF